MPSGSAPGDWHSDWPQPGDEALLVQPYSGTRYGAAVKRTTVAKVTKSQVVLANDTRFTKSRISEPGRADLPNRDAWTPSLLVLHPEHPQALRYMRENALAAATGRVRSAAGELVHLAQRDSQGGEVTAEAVAAVTEAWTALAAARQRYGLPVPAAAGADGQHEDGGDDDDEQDRVDGDAEDDRHGHDEEG